MMNKPQPKVTSISDMRYYKQCRQLWDFASPLRQNLRPNRSPHYFMFGRGFHMGMEAYFNGEDPLNAFELYMLDEAMAESIPIHDETLNEMIDFGFDLIEEFIRWFPTEGFGFDFEVIATEEPHSLHLFDDVYYGFRTDLIIRRKDNNTLWLVDFKTASVMPSENALQYLDNDEQATAYICASERVCDCHFSGIIFLFACTKRFQEPRVLKSGGLSKNVQQYTTLKKFESEMTRLSLDPDDYFDIINILKNKNPFNVVPVIRSETEKEWFWNNNLMPVVQEMAGNPLIYPCPSRMNCGTCSFTGPCIAKNDSKLSEKPMLDMFYTKGEPRYHVDTEHVDTEEV